MTGRTKWMAILAALLVCAVPAFANTIGPGGSGPPDALTLGSGYTVLADTGNLNWSYTTTSGTTSGLAESIVISDPSNTFCPGCLDFVFAVYNNASSVDTLDRITDSSFDAFSTDVGYLTNLTCTMGPNINPYTVDRGPVGNVVGFNYPVGQPQISPGDCTAALVVETNATDYVAGNLSIIDSGVATVDSYAPSAAEPASAVLLLIVVAAGVLLAKRTATA